MGDCEAGKAQDERARFCFGRHWARYLALSGEERIATAEQCLRNMLGRESLNGLRFLDTGSGGGLFSLAPQSLAVTVHSFDYDWIGGWPFEVTKPEKVFNFLRQKGFHVQQLRGCRGRHGCNEAVIRPPSVAC